MRAYYAARAAEYDAVYARPERQDDLRAIAAWLPPHFAGARVLDVACGTGWWTRRIAPVAAGLVGIDAAPETLAIARARVAAAQARFEVGDAYALAPSLGRFDAAFAGFWFSHLPRARRLPFLRGLGERLAPGATVVLLDNRDVPGSSLPLAGTDPAGDTWQWRRLADGSTHRVLKNHPGEDELQGLLPGLGTDGRFVTWPHYWAFTYRRAA